MKPTTTKLETFIALAATAAFLAAVVAGLAGSLAAAMVLCGLSIDLTLLA